MRVFVNCPSFYRFTQHMYSTWWLQILINVVDWDIYDDVRAIRNECTCIKNVWNSAWICKEWLLLHEFMSSDSLFCDWGYPQLLVWSLLLGIQEVALWSLSQAQFWCRFVNPTCTMLTAAICAYCNGLPGIARLTEIQKPSVHHSLGKKAFTIWFWNLKCTYYDAFFGLWCHFLW